MQLYFLEIVTRDVDAVCDAYQRTHGVTFSDPVPEFGNARTADMPGGGMYSVRAPMAEVEEPVVRPYMLVEDIEAATAAAVEAGAELAHPPMEIPGRGKFSIYILGENHFGLWER